MRSFITQKAVFAFPLILLVTFFSTLGTAQSEIWNEKYWNPVPLTDDLVLPMPCGGAMAFRPVGTPNSDGAIGDISVLLGQEGGDQPFLNGLRRSYVSGAFSNGADPMSKGIFYIAKYELAQAQYNAVVSAECLLKEQRKLDFLPATNLTKLDFESFGEIYTVWLLKNAADALPKTGDVTAYLRLPTEEEWEFAARGGLAVDEPLFRAPLPPIPTGLSQNEFIASAGNDSTGGKVQIIGTLKANPLGVHDMLGNVSEYVLTPFALVRHGRLHGQAGGAVKRGGNARTPLNRISSALRQEVAPFDLISKTVTKDDFTGARFVLAGLSISSHEQSDAIVIALDELATADSALTTASSENEILEQLDRLAGSASSTAEASQYRVISDTIKAGRAENNEQRDKSVRLIINAAVLSCDQTVQRYLNALAISALLPSYHAFKKQAAASGDPALVDEVDQAIAEADVKLQNLRDLIDREITDYATLIEGLASEYSLSLLKQQARAVATRIKDRGSRRVSCLISTKTHIEAWVAAGHSELKEIDTDMRDIARSEAN
jgi:hypothetical protein